MPRASGDAPNPRSRSVIGGYRVGMGNDMEGRFTAAREALNAGDTGPFLALMADDVMWWETGDDAPLIGRDAVANRLDELVAFGIHDDVHDVLANAEHLVALIHAETRGEKGPFSYSTAEVYHFADDGRISKRQAFAHDTSKIERFFGQSS